MPLGGTVEQGGSLSLSNRISMATYTELVSTVDAFLGQVRPCGGLFEALRAYITLANFML